MSWNLILVLIMWLNVALLEDMVNGECEHLPVVINSSNNATHSGPYSDGEIIAYKCDENFSSLDYPFYKCVGNTFVGNMSCTECKCNKPNTTDKHIIVYNKNCYISIACSLGYTCYGQASLFCRPDGQLSPSQPPECRPVSCGTYGTVENGHITFISETGNNTVFGSAGMIECNDGFLLDGEKYFTCQSDGKWSAKGTCKPFSCPALPGIQSNCVEKTHLSSNNYYLKCRDDVPTTDIGETTSPLKCLGSNWLNQGRSCFCHCDKRDLEKQIVIHGLEDVNEIPHGNILHWTCANGTKDNASRNGQMQCFDGKFYNQPSCLPELDGEKRSDEDEHFVNKHPTDNDAKGNDIATTVAISVSLAAIVFALVVTIIIWRAKLIRDGEKEEAGMETSRDTRKRPDRGKLYKAPRPFKVIKSSKRLTKHRFPFGRENNLPKLKENQEKKSDASCQESTKFELKNTKRKTTEFRSGQIHTSVAEQNQTAKPGHIEIAMDEKIYVFTDENGGEESNSARYNLSEQHCIIL